MPDANKYLDKTGLSYLWNKLKAKFVSLDTNQTITGTKTFSSSGGFNYSGITDSTNNTATNIWFSDSTNTGTPVKNDSFVYNPSTNNLTVGNVTGNVNGYSISYDVYPLITITQSLTVTTEWMDTGIVGSSLGSSGTFIVQLSGANRGIGGLWGEIFSGITSNYATTTNSGESDEILLQNTGHAPNGGDLFLRWVRTSRAADGNLKLQIASQRAFTEAQNMVFKFRKVM